MGETPRAGDDEIRILWAVGVGLANLPGVRGVGEALRVPNHARRENNLS